MKGSAFSQKHEKNKNKILDVYFDRMTIICRGPINQSDVFVRIGEPGNGEEKCYLAHAGEPSKAIVKHHNDLKMHQIVGECRTAMKVNQ